MIAKPLLNHQGQFQQAHLGRDRRTLAGDSRRLAFHDVGDGTHESGADARVQSSWVERAASGLTGSVQL